jgi:hypothetical protein
MGMLDDDLSAIHADALSLGMADAVTYTTTAAVVTTGTGTFMEMPEPFIHAEGAEVRRRTCQFECGIALIASPSKGDTVTAASCVYAGTWTVVDCGSADSAGWVLTVRLDDRVKMGTGRRMP